MMSKNKDEQVSLKEAFQLNRRALQIMFQYCPACFLSSGIRYAILAVTPYVGIFLSAKIITELAGERRSEVLWPLVILTVCATAVLALLSAVLLHWDQRNCDLAFPYQKDKVYVDKMLDLDFSSIDDAHTHALRADIRQSENWSGWNFIVLLQCYRVIIQSVISIVSAIALTVGLFTTKVPSSAGKLTFLNHPAFMIGFILLLLALTVLAPMLATKAEAYWSQNSEGAKMGNRFFSFFGFMAVHDHSRALDVRIYNQQHVCDHYMSKSHSFDTQSDFAKAFRGPAGRLTAASAALSIVFTGIAYVYVCLKSWSGAFGVGSVTQYIGAITALSKGISDLLSHLGQLRANAFFLRTTFELLDIPNDMYQGSLTTEKRGDRNYEVEFRNVSFHYPNTDVYALRHVNMKFKIGERLAVVGMNGSGKTTFIKLLCRLYDPTEGEILLNGIDIRKYNYDDYMSIFSVVFQDFQLLAYPLGQNVAARATYDKARVIECLEKVGFGAKLAKMPDGTETCLYRDFDDKGVEISGGEAQKIAIARALYKDAPFIILDEPTAALDPIAEAEIYSRFSEIATDKTTVYISHRLSSCRFCDEIMVFDEGNVVQQGTHEKLVHEENGKYYELWNAQAQYYA